MKNRTTGLLIIALSFLSGVIVYGFNQLSNAVKQSAIFIKSGGSLSTKSQLTIARLPIIFIILSVAIGIFIFFIKEKNIKRK